MSELQIKFQICNLISNPKKTQVKLNISFNRGACSIFSTTMNQMLHLVIHTHVCSGTWFL